MGPDNGKVPNILCLEEIPKCAQWFLVEVRPRNSLGQIQWNGSRSGVLLIDRPKREFVGSRMFKWKGQTVFIHMWPT